MYSISPNIGIHKQERILEIHFLLLSMGVINSYDALHFSILFIVDIKYH